MPNEQTSVPLFVANTVLTASQQNLSAGTGVPVFATTVTRDAAFGGSNKALAEGQLCYLSSTNVVQYYDGAAWATVGPASAGGLVFLSGGTFTTASSVSLAANTFTATYTNYQLNINLTANTVDGNALNWRGRVSGTDDSNANYAFGLRGVRFSDGAATAGGNGTSQTSARFTFMQSPFETGVVAATIFAPQLASATSYVVNSTGRGVGDPDGALAGGGYFDNTTQFDSLSFFPASGTISGTYQVYGLAIA
jgi:hypothetical protein